MIAEMAQGAVAPALEAGQGLAQGAAQAIEPLGGLAADLSAEPVAAALTEVGGEGASLLSQTASGMTPAEVMGQFSGPQMSQVPAELGPAWAQAAPNMSTEAGAVFAEAPVSSGSQASEGVSENLLENEWVKKAGKAARKFASSASRSQSQNKGNAPAPVQHQPGPPLDPYVSGLADEQEAFSKSIMDDYLRSGGAFYG
jgi:hypothetical protein